MQIIDGETFLDANEAIAMLGVKRATLYAYVSRKLLSSYKQGVGRQRLYKRSEIEALLTIRPDSEADQAVSSSVDLPYAETWMGDH